MKRRDNLVDEDDEFKNRKCKRQFQHASCSNIEEIETISRQKKRSPVDFSIRENTPNRDVKQVNKGGEGGVVITLSQGSRVTQ